MNKVNLVGRLTRPRAQRALRDQGLRHALAVNGTATRRRFSSTSSPSASCAESSAELKKGAEVEVDGALRYSEWEAKGRQKQTQKRSKHSVIARELVAA